MAISGQNVDRVRKAARPIVGSSRDYDPLLELVGDARYILLGEASHGSHEFYRARAEITRRLIAEKNFTVVAWEADWPDALRVSRFIRGPSADASREEALRGFQRFPTWMWRNADILELVGWLKDHNAHLPAGTPLVGVYGLDLYSLHASMDAVIGYLDKVDPAAAKDARLRYACFEHFGEDPQSYGLTASQHQALSCEDEVVRQLAELQRQGAEWLAQDGKLAADELFFAEQNARVAKNAEQYYRAMYRGRPNTWNLRDTHMADTLDNLLEHLERQGAPAKAIIWAHNSHLGDARATQMGERGELNLGQLMRERHPGQSVLVGFTTYAGWVSAASDWGAAVERKRVRPGMRDSYEALFHDVGIPAFYLPIRAQGEVIDAVRHMRLERAIGVIYRPETERYSHYFHANLAEQFDAVIHFDETSAVEPLETDAAWQRGELPETYPSGL